MLSCIVHAADMQDQDGAKLMLAQATFDFARLRIIRADAGHAGRRGTRWPTRALTRVRAGLVELDLKNRAAQSVEPGPCGPGWEVQIDEPEA